MDIFEIINNKKISELEDQVKSINIKNYKANIDLTGTADESATFTSALNDCIEKNVTLFLPKGIYNLTGVSVVLTENVSICGESIEDTILVGISKIEFQKGIKLQDLYFKDSTGVNVIVFNPSSGFHDVTLKNVKAYNTSHDFTDKTVNNRFFYCNKYNSSYGINKLLVEGCDIQYFAGASFSARCTINQGRIAYNTMMNNGYDTATGIYMIILGDYVTLLGANNIEICNNHFENIWSAKSLVGDSNEAHFVLTYGEYNNIHHNYGKGIYGGGKTAEYLDGGLDHEGFYTKATGSEVYSNIAIDCCGLNSDGAITVKGQKANIHDNQCYLTYGNGIVASDTSGAIIYNNRIEITTASKGIMTYHGNSHIYNNDVTILGGESYTAGIISMGDKENTSLITGNKIRMSVGYGIYSIANGEITNNHIIMYADGRIGIRSLNASISIRNNYISVEGETANEAYCIMTYSSLGASSVDKIVIDGNVLIHTRQGVGSSAVIREQNMLSCIVRNNVIDSNTLSVYLPTLSVDNSFHLFEGNDVKMVAGQLSYIASSNLLCDLIYRKNRIHYGVGSSGNSAINMDVLTSPFEFSHNMVTIEADVSYFLDIEALRHTIIGNEIYLTCTNPVNSMFRMHNDVDSVEVNQICDNRIKSLSKVVQLINYRDYGDGKNIGSVIVSNNIALLTTGSLIKAGGQLTCVLLSINNNTIKTSSSDKEIAAAQAPISGYLATGTIAI